MVIFDIKYGEQRKTLIQMNQGVPAKKVCYLRLLGKKKNRY